MATFARRDDTSALPSVAPMTRRPLLMTLGLLVLAPTVGEFLLGNIPVSQYASVLILIPLYGAGALLVREAGRRLGGWPTLALFAAAYALVEEAPVDQMVFNPGYLGQDFFDPGTVIPGLGVSGTLVIYSVALHTVWSICVPIALVEAFDPTPTLPWLRTRGLVVTAAVFVAGCVFLGVDQADELDFVGTPLQFGVAAVAILALVGAGVAVGRRPAPAPRPGRPPRPWLVGVEAFLLTSGYWLVSGVPGLVAQTVVFLATAGVAVLVVRRWSRRRGWDGRHRLALGAGAAATYGLWFGPAQAGELGTGPAEIAVGALVFGLAVLLVVLAGRRAVRRAPTATETMPALPRGSGSRS